MRYYVTTTPHASAIELVYADVLARHYRLTGARVRFLGGGSPALRPMLSLSYTVFNNSSASTPWYTTGMSPSDYQRWWVNSDARVHVVGESSPRPQLSHSSDAVCVCPDFDVSEVELLVRRYGSDAVRWWLLRSRVDGQLVPMANKDLHNSLGTFVDRVTGLVHRYRDGEPPPGGNWPSAQVAPALARFDFVAATDAVRQVVRDAADYLARSRPWELADPDEVLANLLAACRVLANDLIPFLPDLATRIAEQCFALSGSLAPARALYPRLKK